MKTTLETSVNDLKELKKKITENEEEKRRKYLRREDEETKIIYLQQDLKTLKEMIRNRNRNQLDWYIYLSFGFLGGILATHLHFL